jgi:hypothetical protein
MRKLQPIKAISHALNAVWNFRSMAVRICMMWAPLVIAAGLAEYAMGPPDPRAQELTPEMLVQVLTGIVSLLATCSIAVSWHRFILRDEPAAGLRLDAGVFRYAGNTLLILLVMLVPALLMLIVMEIAPRPGAILGLPVIVLAGGVMIRASIKLPAVALGDKTFSFRDAWRASEGNFWPCIGVFLLSAGMLFATLLVLTVAADLLGRINEDLSLIVLLAAGIVLQLFFALFNASIMTSLYGFFVERRDF